MAFARSTLHPAQAFKSCIPVCFVLRKASGFIAAGLRTSASLLAINPALSFHCGGINADMRILVTKEWQYTFRKSCSRRETRKSQKGRPFHPAAIGKSPPERKSFLSSQQKERRDCRLKK